MSTEETYRQLRAVEDRIVRIKKQCQRTHGRDEACWPADKVRALAGLRQTANTYRVSLHGANR